MTNVSTEISIDLQQKDINQALRNLVTDIEQGKVLVSFLDVQTTLDAEDGGGFAEIAVTLRATRLIDRTTVSTSAPTAPTPIKPHGQFNRVRVDAAATTFGDVP